MATRNQFCNNCDCIGGWRYCDEIGDQEWVLTTLGNITQGSFTMTVAGPIVTTATIPWNAVAADVGATFLNCQASGGPLPNNPIVLKFTDGAARTITAKSTPTQLQVGKAFVYPQYSNGKLGYLFATVNPVTSFTTAPCAKGFNVCNQATQLLFTFLPVQGDLGRFQVAWGILIATIPIPSFPSTSVYYAVYVDVPINQRPTWRDFRFAPAYSINQASFGVRPGQTFGPTSGSCNPLTLNYQFPWNGFGDGSKFFPMTASVVQAEDLSNLSCNLPIDTLDLIRLAPQVTATIFAPSIMQPCNTIKPYPNLPGPDYNLACRTLDEVTNTAINGQSIQLLQHPYTQAGELVYGTFRSANPLPMSSIVQTPRYNFQEPDAPFLQNPSYQRSINAFSLNSPPPLNLYDFCQALCVEPIYNCFDYTRFNFLFPPIAFGANCPGEFVEASAGYFELGIFVERGDGTIDETPTAQIPYNASANAVQTAVNNALLSRFPGNPSPATPVVCTGGPLPTTPIVITGNQFVAGGSGSQFNRWHLSFPLLLPPLTAQVGAIVTGTPPNAVWTDAFAELRGASTFVTPASVPLFLWLNFDLTFDPNPNDLAGTPSRPAFCHNIPTGNVNLLIAPEITDGAGGTKPNTAAATAAGVAAKATSAPGPTMFFSLYPLSVSQVANLLPMVNLNVAIWDVLISP